MQTHTSIKTSTLQSSKIKYLTMGGLMAAMITIMTAYIAHIPVGANGGYIHFGDSVGVVMDEGKKRNVSPS